MPPSDRAFRVGVIGTGFVARGAHLPGWRAVPGAEVTALCDTDSAALEAARRGAPAARAFSDYRALLAEDLDAVSVCAPNALHFAAARDALRAGRHVLCEKPLCVSAAETAALGAEADARGLVLMARHQLRFTGAARAARERMRAGDAGFVHHARVRALRRDRIPTTPGLIDREQAGGGAGLDLGVHALDMALWLMDFPRAVRVTGTARTNFGRGRGIAGHWGDWDRARFSVEDFAAGFVHFDNGATLALESAWAGHYEDGDEGLGCVLFGDKGSLHWPSGAFVSQDAARGTVFRREIPEIGATPTDPPPEFLAFYRACLAGDPSPVPWREARASVGIIEALYRSAREGKEIVISDQ
jgi:predicted dehydrogenase